MRFVPKPSEEFASKTDGVEFKVIELQFTAIMTTHEFELSEDVTDSVKRVFGDEEISSIR